MTADCTRRRWLATLPVLAVAVAETARAEGDLPRIEWPALVTVQGDPLAALPGQGVPGLVVFWATWCAFCRRHNAHVDRLYREVDASRLRILGVATDRDIARVHGHLQAMGWRFPVVMNQGRLMARFTSRRLVPMSCLVDAHGRLLQAIPGEMAEADVLELARLTLPAPR